MIFWAFQKGLKTLDCSVGKKIQANPVIVDVLNLSLRNRLRLLHDGTVQDPTKVINCRLCKDGNCTATKAGEKQKPCSPRLSLVSAVSSE